MKNFLRNHYKKILGLLVFKKLVVLLIIFSLAVPKQPANAQALPVAPVANMVVNRLIAGTITKAAASRGFAANDPRIAATLVGVQSSVSALNVVATVAGVGLAVAGAPVWLTVAAGLGVFAIGAALIAGTTRLELQQGNLKVIKPAFTAPNYTYPTPTDIPNFAFKSLTDAGLRVYRSPDGCFVTQACMAFPAIPAGVEFPILATYSGRPAYVQQDQVLFYPFRYPGQGSQEPDERDQVHNDGEVAVGFVSITDFRDHFAMVSPISPGQQGNNWIGSKRPGIAGQEVVIYTLRGYTPGNDMDVIIAGTYTDWFTWKVDPVLQISSITGERRIVGQQTWHRRCNGSTGDANGNDGDDVCHPELWYARNNALDFDATFDSSAPFNPVYQSSDPYIGFTPVKRLYLSPNFSPEDYDALDAAYRGLSGEQKNATVSPEFLARLVDKAWATAASKPGYEGLPYSVTQPVTVEEVTAYTSTQPAVTLNDLLVPASDPGVNTVPIGVAVQPLINTSAPGSNVNVVNTPNVNVVNTPNVNVVNDLHVDLGPDPGIGAPILESIPTAATILAPIVGLFPDLKNYQPPPRVGECPKPSTRLDYFDMALTIEAHCSVIDDVAPTLTSVMTLAWSALAIFLILSA